MDIDDVKKPLKPISWYKNLDSVKGRMESRAFLVDGERAVKQVSDYYSEEIMEILSVPAMAPLFSDLPIRIMTEKQIASISSTKTPQGIIAVVRLPEHVSSDKLPVNPGPRILLLEDIQDPGNVGTIIRTAAAFGFSGVIMSDKTADPFSAKTVQSTAGSILSLWIRRTGNYLSLVKSLVGRGYKVAAADLNGTTGPSILRDIPKLVIAMGNEASGLSKTILNIADYRVKIPVDRKNAESLNVAVCSAILMYLASIT